MQWKSHSASKFQRVSTADPRNLNETTYNVPSHLRRMIQPGHRRLLFTFSADARGSVAKHDHDHSCALESPHLLKSPKCALSSSSVLDLDSDVYHNYLSDIFELYFAHFMTLLTFAFHFFLFSTTFPSSSPHQINQRIVTELRRFLTSQIHNHSNLLLSS